MLISRIPEIGSTAYRLSKSPSTKPGVILDTEGYYGRVERIEGEFFISYSVGDDGPVEQRNNIVDFVFEL